MGPLPSTGLISIHRCVVSGILVEHYCSGRRESLPRMQRRRGGFFCSSPSPPLPPQKPGGGGHGGDGRRSFSLFGCRRTPRVIATPKDRELGIAFNYNTPNHSRSLGVTGHPGSLRHPKIQNAAYHTTTSPRVILDLWVSQDTRGHTAKDRDAGITLSNLQRKRLSRNCAVSGTTRAPIVE